jgi:hypothetical protein
VTRRQRTGAASFRIAAEKARFLTLKARHSRTWQQTLLANEPPTAWSPIRFMSPRKGASFFEAATFREHTEVVKTTSAAATSSQSGREQA